VQRPRLADPFRIHTTVFLSPDERRRPCAFVDGIKVVVTRGSAVEGTVGHVVMSDAGGPGVIADLVALMLCWGGSHVGTRRLLSSAMMWESLSSFSFSATFTVERHRWGAVQKWAHAI
jgi:hypothetical protein